MKIHLFDQYSDKWYRARIGIPTASQFHHIVTPGGVPTRGDKRKKYMFKLIAEKLLQQSLDDDYESYWMRRARDLEDEAAEKFCAFQRTTADKVGFITTDDGRIGASPDRLLKKGKEGLEIKCPSPWVQVEYLLEGVQDNYKPQVQGAMLVCEFRKVHLWAYHPQMPPVHIETQRDDDYIKVLAKELFVFCNEMDVEVDRARRQGPFKLAELLRLSAEMRDDTLPGTFPWLQ